MKRRKWTSRQKALIVLEGMKGRPIGELCADHEISQAQYYQWRDQFLKDAHRAFERADDQGCGDTRESHVQNHSADLFAHRRVGEVQLRTKKREQLAQGYVIASKGQR